MSSSMWGYLFLVLGIIGAALLILFGSITSNDEQNYYLLKEVTEAAMLDSVDDSAYKNGLSTEEIENNDDSIYCNSGVPGTVRIVKEKFVENFTRRFAETAGVNTNYTIKFYDIDECPPKVSVQVISTQNYSWVRRLLTGEFNTDDDNVEIINELTAILESRS